MTMFRKLETREKEEDRGFHENLKISRSNLERQQFVVVVVFRQPPARQTQLLSCAISAVAWMDLGMGMFVLHYSSACSIPFHPYIGRAVSRH